MIFVVLNTAAGPAHRQQSPSRMRCGEHIGPAAIQATLLACQVFEVPVCVRCFPLDSAGRVRNQPSGAR